MLVFSSLPACAGSQKPLAQNNPYSKKADLGVAYSCTLHLYRLSNGASIFSQTVRLSIHGIVE